MRQKTVIPTAAIDDQGLTGRDLRVLAAICYQDPDAAGHLVSPARADLAAVLASNESNISRSLTRLCHRGWLTRRHIGRKGHPSRYSINWDHLPGKVSEIDTLSPGNKVSEIDTLKNKVPERDTLSDKVSVNGTLPPEDKVSVNGTLPDKMSEKDTLSVDNSDKVSVNGTPDQDHDDDIYTNQDHHQGDLTPQAVHDLLASHRINGIASAHARTLINSWIERGVTAALLEKAVQRSLTHCKNGVPGVPYVDRAIGSLLDEATGKSAGREQEFHDTPNEDIPWLNQG